jgi:hypothetical protein
MVLTAEYVRYGRLADPPPDADPRRLLATLRQRGQHLTDALHNPFGYLGSLRHIRSLPRFLAKVVAPHSTRVSSAATFRAKMRPNCVGASPESPLHLPTCLLLVPAGFLGLLVGADEEAPAERTTKWRKDPLSPHRSRLSQCPARRGKRSDPRVSSS